MRDLGILRKRRARFEIVHFRLFTFEECTHGMYHVILKMRVPPEERTCVDTQIPFRFGRMRRMWTFHVVFGRAEF